MSHNGWCTCSWLSPGFPCSVASFISLTKGYVNLYCLKLYRLSQSLPYKQPSCSFSWVLTPSTWLTTLPVIRKICCSSIWSHTPMQDINAVESVQKFATWLIAYHWDQIKLQSTPGAYRLATIILSSRQTHLKLHQVYILRLFMDCITFQRFFSRDLRHLPTMKDMQGHIYYYTNPLHI